MGPINLFFCSRCMPPLHAHQNGPKHHIQLIFRRTIALKYTSTSCNSVFLQISNLGCLLFDSFRLESMTNKHLSNCVKQNFLLRRRGEKLLKKSCTCSLQIFCCYECDLGVVGKRKKIEQGGL